MIAFIVVTCFTLAYAIDEYTFQCKPKAGCDFSQCGAIPKHFLDLEGFNADEYRKRNEYHISCEPKSDIKGIISQNNGIEDFGYMTESQMREAIQTMMADVETRFDERISKQDKEHKEEIQKLKGILNKNESERKRLSTLVENLRSRIDSMPGKDKTQPDNRENISKVEKSPQKSCKGVIWNKGCFWPVIQSAFTVAYKDAEHLCDSDGGFPANVYSREHYKEVVRYALNITKVGRLWIGMTFDTEARTMMLTTGKPSQVKPKWLTIVSQFRKSYTQLYIFLRENDARSGMNVFPQKFRLEGVICERQ